ncbi:flagellar hook-length control protein FliK [Pseudoduganella namucuonensis]|uniref:Hook-length control protein FliK n=1 Tax=Pseudoduganella namucuonensis TaxID=1035707 RepID=A0A1I7HSY8_9BURK|nr:flagellar hook-length control protein FliK [Pseudoduganella namucuonensis]SFU63855.1 hook-length control protein FliK [Pseudoduganella namucuonensis]
MAIDRLSPPAATLTIPERIVREQPGQAQVIPPVATVAGEEASFTLPPGLPAAIGALVDAPDGVLRQNGPGALAGLLQAQSGHLADPASLRPDQLQMSRQLVWQQPDAATMAISWQVMVRTYGEQRAALQDQAAGQKLPSGLFMTEHAQAVVRDGREGRAAPAMVSELESWRFAVYAWGAEKLVLRVVSRDPGEEEEPRRRRARIAIRLELHLPGMGKVLVQMEPSGDGVVLEIGANQNAAMQYMRDLLPQLAAIISRNGLSLVRCHLMRELAPVREEYNNPTRVQTAMLTQSVFKSMAEVAVLLSQPQQPRDLFSESA